MSCSIRLGLMFSYREGWIGGSYYILNLISALKRLEEQDRPDLTVFAFSDSELDQVRALDYSGANYRVLHEPPPGPVFHLVNRVSSRLIGHPVKRPPAIQDDLDVVYPGGTHPRFRKIPNQIFWIPDFQEEHLPEMFGQKRIQNRRRVRGRIAREAKHIVFSSKDAANDFQRFYPRSEAIRHVLNFAVTHPDYQQVDIDALRQKYQLGNLPFFLVSNQFWKHKNHRVVIEAMNLMSVQAAKQRFLVCFSGKEEDARNPGYAGEIRGLVKQYQLEESVRFLGFMERLDQLRLMKESIAVVQPSLFEGWSTVIEDAKALSVPIIASDLPVHFEQLGNHGTYFSKNDPEDLAKRMQDRFDGDLPRNETLVPYSEHVQAFGRQFVGILRAVVGRSLNDKDSDVIGPPQSST